MIAVKNCTKSSVDKRFLVRVATMVLGGEKSKRQELSVALVNEGESKKLNMRYLAKNHAANVLSFPIGEFGLGEIVLCPAVIRREAKKYDMIQKHMLAFFLIHGILHLFGYTHMGSSSAMERRERHYLSFLR